MKPILSLISLLLASVSTFGQIYTQQLSLSRDVPVGMVSEQKATQTIVANNQISLGAIARYTASQSVTLQPGFVAQAGSVFTATIAPVVVGSSISDVPGLTVRAYPNPFAVQTTVDYTLPLSGSVRHTLMDARGQVVQQSEEATEQSAGLHQTQVDGRNLPEGVYLFRLQVGSESRTLRLVKKP